MVAGESMPRAGAGEDGSGRTPEAETPTPAMGLPLGAAMSASDRHSTTDQFPAVVDAGEAIPGGKARSTAMDDLTPAHGIEGLSEAIAAEEFGTAGPAVLGDTGQSGTAADEAGDWPKLEYRSRNKPDRGGTLDFLRRRRGE